MTARGNKDGFPVGMIAGRAGHRHRLGDGSRFIEQRGVCHIESSQVSDHRLEIDQRFQPALRDLCLIRRVGGIPARILEDVSQEMMSIATEAA